MRLKMKRFEKAHFPAHKIRDGRMEVSFIQEEMVDYFPIRSLIRFEVPVSWRADIERNTYVIYAQLKRRSIPVEVGGHFLNTLQFSRLWFYQRISILFLLFLHKVFSKLT